MPSRKTSALLTGKRSIMSRNLTRRAATQVLAGAVATGLIGSSLEANAAHATNRREPAYAPDVVIATRTATRNTFFPSITRSHTGQLLVIYYDSPVHATNNAGRIAMVRSIDNGLHWSSPRTVIDTPIDDRDPSITTLSNGHLLINWFSRDANAPGTFHTNVSQSTDNGQTWSAPTKVGSSMAGAATSAPIVELDNGDLLVPLYGYASEASPLPHQVTVVRSTDGGATWPQSSEVLVGNRPGGNDYSLQEPAVANLGNGNVIMITRSTEPSARSYLMRSDDNGFTWSAPELLNFSAHCPDILVLDDYDRMLVTWGDWSDTANKGRPVYGLLVGYNLDFTQHQPQLLYEDLATDTPWNPFVDISYPSSVELRRGRFLTVFYNAERGFIGGKFTTISDYLS